MAQAIGPRLNPVTAGATQPLRTSIVAAPLNSEPVATVSTESASIQQPAAPVELPGTHLEMLDNGGSLVSADNGVTLIQGGGAAHLSVPGGEQIVWSQGNDPIGTRPEGVFPVQTFKGADGQTAGYGFTRADGTSVTVNTTDFSVVYQSKDKSVTQNIDADGGQLIKASSDYRTPEGKYQTTEQKVFVDPKGGVFQLGGECKGLQVCRTGLSFTNPSNWKVSKEFPLPLTLDPTGDMAAPVKAAPVARAAPVAAPAMAPGPLAGLNLSSLAPLLADVDSHFPGNFARSNNDQQPDPMSNYIPDPQQYDDQQNDSGGDPNPNIPLMFNPARYISPFTAQNDPNAAQNSQPDPNDPYSAPTMTQGMRYQSPFAEPSQPASQPASNGLPDWHDYAATTRDDSDPNSGAAGGYSLCKSYTSTDS
jgi:hypothetical protein